MIRNIILGFILFVLIGIAVKLDRIADDTTTLATIEKFKR